AAKAQRIMHAARAGGFERHQRGEQFQNLPRILRMLRRKIGEYGTLALAMQIEKPGGQLLQRIALAASDTWRPRGNEGAIHWCQLSQSVKLCCGPKCSRSRASATI